MPHLYGEKIKGLKKLYAFRILLKSEVVAYKKAIGNEPDHAQLKQILYICIDMASTTLAAQSGLGRKSYADICEDIDRRYRLNFEELVQAASFDDPMGLSNLLEGGDGNASSAAPAFVEPEAQQQAATTTAKRARLLQRTRQTGRCHQQRKRRLQKQRWQRVATKRKTHQTACT